MKTFSVLQLNLSEPNVCVYVDPDPLFFRGTLKPPQNVGSAFYALPKPSQTKLCGPH